MRAGSVPAAPTRAARDPATMRRSRLSCPSRLRSARESDLRASSLRLRSHYVVELRSDASSQSTLGFYTARRFAHCTASFSLLARRRCLRRVRIISAPRTDAQEAETSRRRFSTRKFRCPRESPALHAFHKRFGRAIFPISAGAWRRRAHAAGTPCRRIVRRRGYALARFRPPGSRGLESTRRASAPPPRPARSSRRVLSRNACRCCGMLWVFVYKRTFLWMLAFFGLVGLALSGIACVSCDHVGGNNDG